jgi:ankyrin repeat protein
MAHVLLSAGANPNLVDGIGRAPLHIAVENKDEACVRMLLKSAANVNIQDSDGNTPLHWGAMVDAGKCIRCLLEWRADIMMVNSTNQPPSQIAVSNDFGECVRLLQNGNTNAASELDPMSFLMGASPAAPEESTPPVESSARSAGSGSGVWACFGDDEDLSMQYPAPASPMPKLFFGGYEGQDVAKGRPHAGILKNKNKNK